MPSPGITGGGVAAVETPPRTPRRWPHVLGIGAMVSICAAVYCAYLLGVHARLKDGLADVGEYDQAISGYAHFMGPHSPFVALHSVADAGKLQLSDHFTPLLAVLAPFYWIHDGPETLLIETGVLAALPIIPLWVFTRRAVGGSRVFGVLCAYLVAAGYGVAWPLQIALWIQFHEVFFAIPIMIWMIERAQAGRPRQAAAISLLLLGVKDDLGFVVAVFGVYLAARGAAARDWTRLLRRGVRRPAVFVGALRRDGRLGLLSLVPIGLGAVVLVNQVLLPAFGGSPTRNFTYSEFGPTTGAAIKAMLAAPGTTVGTLFNSPLKTQTLSMLLWPVLGLCLLSPITLMAVPLLVERFLSVNTLYWGMPYHYNAFLIPMIFCGGVDGAMRLARWVTSARPTVFRLGERGALTRGALVTCFAVYVAAYGTLTSVHYPLHKMARRQFWNTSSPDVVAGKLAAAHVPSGVAVAAATQVGPQLLSRDKVVMWAPPGERGYPDMPWVVADVKRPSFPFNDLGAQQADVDWLKTKGYRVVFARDGWIVLHQEPDVAG
jgi:uncharacterized membrane protein